MKSIYILLLASFLMASSCSDTESQPLDSFQEGDVSAQHGDIEMNSGLNYSVRTVVHPHIKGLMGGGAGLERTLSFQLADSLFHPMRQKGMKIQGNVDGSGKPLVDNNGRNILLSQHIDVNKEGEAYRLTITARQGRYFWQRSIERGAGREHPKVLQPVSRHPIDASIDGVQLKTMEETRINAIRYDQNQSIRSLLNALNQNVAEKSND